MAGRPPKPTALKVMTGADQYHKERLNDAEPQPPAGELARPTWLLPKARKHWDRFMASIMSMNVGTPVDAEGLGSLCNALQEYLDASKEVQKHGLLMEEHRYDKEGNVVGSSWKANPAVTARADAWRRMNLMLQQFGLTPSSRAKVKVTKPEEVDEFEALLKRKA